MDARRRLAVVPPLLAGLAAAVALETSTGLLLYNDDGLLPALTLILTIEVGALGFGLLTGPLPVGGGAVEQIRRRWMFCLVTFAVASAAGAGLNVSENLQGTALGQGIGLGFLGALPLFSLGTLLGAMGHPDDLGRTPPNRVGPASVLGATLGFFLAGTVLLPNGAPHTLYLLCLVILSGGALLQGWVLDARVTVETLETRVVRGLVLRVERRVLGSPRRELNLLLEGDAIRGAEGPEGEPGRGWEAAVLTVLTEGRYQPESCVCLGGGSGTMARHLSQRFPHARIRVVEGKLELVGLARAHFCSWDGWDHLDVVHGDPLDAIEEDAHRFSMGVLDCAALPGRAGIPALKDADFRVLKDTLEPGGMLILGGLGLGMARAGAKIEEGVDHLAAKARDWFETVSVYQSDGGEDKEEFLQLSDEEPQFIVLLSLADKPLWPTAFGGYSLLPRGGA